ncbi:MAG: helix-turn-helix domain-containing protein [Culicoidibacterales bacterium]
MDIEKLGCNIRLLREGKGLTREQFCEGENELSVRQLMRIEKGESTPTLAKLVFIAGKLGISVTALFNESESMSVIPQQYWNLKYEIEKHNIFDDSEKDKRLAILMEMYDYYYDELPSDEQLFVDCMMTLNDLYEASDIYFLIPVLSKYKYVLDRDVFQANELAYLSIYFIFQIETRNWVMKNDDLIERILTQSVYADSITNEIAIRVYINIITYCITKEDYRKAIEVAEASVHFINLCKSYQRMPIVYMMLAKSYIGLKEFDKGIIFYQKALDLAELIQSESLQSKIRSEKDNDVL